MSGDATPRFCFWLSRVAKASKASKSAAAAEEDSEEEDVQSGRKGCFFGSKSCWIDKIQTKPLTAFELPYSA